MLNKIQPLAYESPLNEFNSLEEVFQLTSANAILFTDGSGSYVGCYFIDSPGQRKSRTFRISEHLQQKHITVKEVFAIWHSLHILSDAGFLTSQLSLMILSDSLPVLQILTENGESQNSLLQEFTHCIYDLNHNTGTAKGSSLSAAQARKAMGRQTSGSSNPCDSLRYSTPHRFKTVA